MRDSRHAKVENWKVFDGEPHWHKHYLITETGMFLKHFIMMLFAPVGFWASREGDNISGEKNPPHFCAAILDSGSFWLFQDVEGKTSWWHFSFETLDLGSLLTNVDKTGECKLWMRQLIWAFFKYGWYHFHITLKNVSAGGKDVAWGCRKLDLFKMWCCMCWQYLQADLCIQSIFLSAHHCALALIICFTELSFGSQHKWPIIFKCSSLLGTSRDCNCKEFLPEIYGSGIIKSRVPHSWLQLSYLVICLYKEDHFLLSSVSFWSCFSMICIE